MIRNARTHRREFTKVIALT
jgi:hypothetical protein